MLHDCEPVKTESGYGPVCSSACCTFFFFSHDLCESKARLAHKFLSKSNFSSNLRVLSTLVAPPTAPNAAAAAAPAPAPAAASLRPALLPSALKRKLQPAPAPAKAFRVDDALAVPFSASSSSSSSSSSSASSSSSSSATYGFFDGAVLRNEYDPLHPHDYESIAARQEPDRGLPSTASGLG
jgi:hypothetical protein